MIAYSGFHFQRPVNDWPRAAAILPDGTWIKFIDNVQALDEAKRVNPGLKTVLRHFDGGWQRFDFANHTERREHARAFLLSFVDGTFLQYAHNVDAIEELNEYNATSHSTDDVQKRVEWVRAVSEEWDDIKRSDSRLSHIRLVVGNVAIGNDLPLEAAQLVQQFGNIAGYHPYVPTRDKQVRPDEWRWYSGRWTEMDARFRAAGITVDWLFTEAGPIGYTGDHLGPNDGWRHPDVCDGDVSALLTVCKYWMDRTALWNYTHGGRALGQVLYNSVGVQNEWRLFEIAQPEMDVIAAFNRDYVPPEPPPPPPPDPEPEPITMLEKELWDTGLQRQAISINAKASLGNRIYSDDMVPMSPEYDVQLNGDTYRAQRAGALTSAERRVYYCKVPRWGTVWYIDAPEPLFASPVGTVEERASGDIWPGDWVNANEFLNRYQLGNGFSIHTGADLNLNKPSWNADKGMPVHAMGHGVVTYARRVPTGTWGRLVVLRHETEEGAVWSRYGHMATLLVEEGQEVRRGDVIGTIGGAEFGLPDHLHFDLSPSGVLATNPTHWPGDNRDLVLEHYTRPETWLTSRR